MKIQLKGNRYLRSYPFGFEIVEYKGVKENKEGKEVEVWGKPSNYSTIPNALKAFAIQEQIDCKATDWEGVEKCINETNKILSEINEKLGGK